LALLSDRPNDIKAIAIAQTAAPDQHSESEQENPLAVARDDLSFSLLTVALEYEHHGIGFESRVSGHAHLPTVA
jgi:hypothetical protein